MRFLNKERGRASTQNSNLNGEDFLKQHSKSKLSK